MARYLYTTDSQGKKTDAPLHNLDDDGPQETIAAQMAIEDAINKGMSREQAFRTYATDSMLAAEGLKRS